MAKIYVTSETTHKHDNVANDYDDDDNNTDNRKFIILLI